MPKIINRVGEYGYTKLGSKMIITDYKDAHNMSVYFPEYSWTVTNAQYSHFKRGSIKCPYEPSVYGIGYLGEGKYKTWENGRKTSAYVKWHNMLERCYDYKKQLKCPKYIGCHVYKPWLNFQNYAQWHYLNYYKLEYEEVHLDKDILVKGNQLYSPKTCCFVPKTINLLFSMNYQGNLPIGVSKFDNKYRVACCDGSGKIISLGLHDDPIIAFEKYKKYKEYTIKKIADKYKHIISKEVYKSMYNYEINIMDWRNGIEL